MNSAYLMGLDIGTSGAKCIIADQEGKVVASKTVEYPLYTPQARLGRAESPGLVERHLPGLRRHPGQGGGSGPGH